MIVVCYQFIEYCKHKTYIIMNIIMTIGTSVMYKIWYLTYRCQLSTVKIMLKI